MDLLKRQIEFMNNLTNSEKEIIEEYTISDVNVSKLYTNYPEDYDLDEKEIKKVKKMKKVLDKLFQEIPKTTKKFTVYRGSRDIYNTPFVSTSLNINVALDFVERNGKNDYKNYCCLYSIEIPRNSSVLPILKISRHPYEEEILLLNNFKVDKNFTIKHKGRNLKGLNLIYNS